MMHAGSTRGFFLLLSMTLGWTKAQQTSNITPVFNCGGDLVAESGFVGSEGFPNFYKPNSKCTWRITVPEGNVITLAFRVFDLEANSQCQYDYLDVYNGPSNLVQKLGRFCGTFRPGNLISTTNTMMLEMVTDEETQSRGFVAYFSGTKPYNGQGVCGGKMTKSQGEIMTPNWPDEKYPPGTSCSWLITVEPDMVIQVNFDKFVLEADTYCRFDYVAFYNGGEKNESHLIGKYCGDQAPQPIISSGNVLLIQFVSDLSVPSDGFFAHYTSIPRGSQIPSVASGRSFIIPIPVSKPSKPKHSVVTVALPTPITQHVTSPAPNPTNKPILVKIIKIIGKGVKSQNERGTLLRKNPQCPKVCKRDRNVKTSFCSSEFVITGKVTSISPGPRGSLFINVSLIKTYKTGQLTITQVGKTMVVKLVSRCRNCPRIRKGMNYIFMGQVDEEGRGSLEPDVFTAPYKALHHRLLTNINKKPC